ncbi:AAA family ATPase [Paraburkholderia aspalathi]|uniref:AAA domain-containing protein n=1 Tax=Paraburkholderia aspalathi TaxID=1324617 RepID=A0A1I6Y4G3_9BURK|nr:helicase RepA family protein [Paraburkholderia aspalathi]SFT45287.1 AAA domain-containing protein [Paraburkholderia aspalathi]
MRYRLQSADDLMNAPPLRWLVRDVVPADSLVALFGPSGSGKSFLALDLCAVIAGGGEWFGHRVTAAPVVYVALEGEVGLSKRAKAWSARNRRTLPDDLRFIMQPFNVSNLSDVDDLARAVLAGGGADLLVLDTLNRAAPGADENSSRDMSQVINNLGTLKDRIGCTVLVVHHTGKDTSKGLRGHSSLFAALDAAIEVRRDGDRREWSDAKVKEGPDGERHRFALLRVDLGEDEDGESVTSCVIAPDESTVAVARPMPSGKTQRLVYAVMDMLLSESRHFDKAGAPSGRPCVELEAVVPVIAERLLCRPDQREYQVRRALTSMTGNGEIYQARGGWLWMN